MLSIFIKGKPVEIKAGTSFDFVSENAMFTDADDYSLSITLPLAGCARNLDALGFINMHGHSATPDPFDMVITAGRNIFRGVGVVMSVSETECKVQFLGQRSADNYKSDLDDVYINSLDLGSVPYDLRVADSVTVKSAWEGHAAGRDFVALPWVNEGTGNINNDTELVSPDDTQTRGPDFHPGADQKWKLPDEADDDPSYQLGLSWMPYLIFIAGKICDATGYAYDFEKWKSSRWNELLICQTVPHTWGWDWADILPHWSVLEFFRNIEPLIEGEFRFDHLAKTVVFTPFAEAFVSGDEVTVDNVFDEFSSDVYETEEECRMMSERFMGYAMSDNKAARAYSCEWLIRDYKARAGKMIVEYDTADALSAKAIRDRWLFYTSIFKGRRDDFTGECSYCRDVDRFVSNRVIMAHQTFTVRDQATGGYYEKECTAVLRVPMMLNPFGPRCVPEDETDVDSPELALNVTPAVIDDTDMRRMIFVPLGESNYESDEPMVDMDNSPIEREIYDSLTMRNLEDGQKDGSNAYFSNLAVGFYPGPSECLRGGNEIFPILDNFEMDNMWSPWHADKKYTLSLQSTDGKFSGVGRVNVRTKFEFSFLADKMPDARSIFVIRGQRYVCEKLTATFSEYGMSEKIKGTFWKIIG